MKKATGDFSPIGGNSPDHWRCVDCAVNTHPGGVGKKDLLAGLAGGVLVLNTPNQEVYTVHDKASARLRDRRGF